MRGHHLKSCEKSRQGPRYKYTHLSICRCPRFEVCVLDSVQSQAVAKKYLYWSCTNFTAHQHDFLGDMCEVTWKIMMYPSLFWCHFPVKWVTWMASVPATWIRIWIIVFVTDLAIHYLHDAVVAIMELLNHGRSTDSSLLVTSVGKGTKQSGGMWIVSQSFSLCLPVTDPFTTACPSVCESFHYKHMSPEICKSTRGEFALFFHLSGIHMLAVFVEWQLIRSSALQKKNPAGKGFGQHSAHYSTHVLDKLTRVWMPGFTSEHSLGVGGSELLVWFGLQVSHHMKNTYLHPSIHTYIQTYIGLMNAGCLFCFILFLFLFLFSDMWQANLVSHGGNLDDGWCSSNGMRHVIVVQWTMQTIWVLDNIPHIAFWWVVECIVAFGQ